MIYNHNMFFKMMDKLFWDHFLKNDYFRANNYYDLKEEYEKLNQASRMLYGQVLFPIERKLSSDVVKLRR